MCVKYAWKYAYVLHSQEPKACVIFQFVLMINNRSSSKPFEVYNPGWFHALKSDDIRTKVPLLISFQKYIIF